MQFLTLAMLLPALVSASAISLEPIANVARGGVEHGEEGSWCYQPKENFRGESTHNCCDAANGAFLNGSKRCVSIKGNGVMCSNFYRCCIDKWSGHNGYNDPCF